jgi:uncharacterized protein involved in exopolysaccharide biosynthesis
MRLDGVSAGEAWGLCWRFRWRIVGSVGLSLFFSAAYLHLASFLFTAELKVVPANPSASSVRMGAIGNLAALAGVSPALRDSGSNFEVYLSELHGDSAARVLIGDAAIASRIFASEWSADLKSWREPVGDLDGVKRAVKWILGVPQRPWTAPDSSRFQAYLQSHLKIDVDPKSSVVRLRYDHVDRQFAVLFLSKLHAAVDAELRKRKRERSEANVRYLSERLASASIVEHRQSLASALVEEEKLLLLANSSAPFAAEPIGPPVASAWPTRPSPGVVLILGAVIGLLMGLMVAVIPAVFRR